MEMVKVKICLTNKMHRIAAWIYVHHDISLSQLTRAAFREHVQDLEAEALKESLQGYGNGCFRTTLNVPIAVNILVTSIASQKGISRSAVIRYVLYRHMQQYNPKAKKPQEVSNG